MAHSTPKNINRNRYQSLIIFITIFVIIIVGVLSINFYFSAQFSDDAKEINLAGRQRMLSQKMAKSLHKLIQAQSANSDIDEAFNELKLTFILFDKTLTAFTKGGSVIGADGQPLLLEQVDIELAKKAIIESNKVWPQYRSAVLKLIESDISPLKALAYSIEYAKEKNENILLIMDELTLSLQNNKYKNIYVNLSGRQRMLSERIIKTLFEIVNAQSANTDTNHLLLQIDNDIQAFDLTLNIFLNGGDIAVDKTKATYLEKVSDDGSINLINQILTIWQPLSISISSILNSNNGIYTTVAVANNFANIENLNLLKLMNNLTIALDQDSSHRSDSLRYIQIFGIVLALIMFAFIVLFFLKHLRKMDVELGQAKQEMDRILETVNDGLFLVDRNHIIGAQHSDSLPRVINVEQPAGMNFLNILRKIVPDKTLQTAKDYLELLYGDRVNAELVKDLNPLDEVEVYFDEEGINKSVGHLGFEFTRVIKNDAISHLLVQVEDVTEKVKLEKELAESKDIAQSQFDLMLQVLHVQPEVLEQFLTETENALSDINKVLQERTNRKNTYQNKLNNISRHMHRIKGDASSLELKGFEQKAHDFENLFEQMRQLSDLSGKEFLPVVIKLDEFMSQIESLRILITKLSELQGSIKKDYTNHSEKSQIFENDSFNNKRISKKLYSLSRSLAAKQNKKIILNIFNERLLPDDYVKPVHDILTQLIRNSIVHGIEKPLRRNSLNKTDEGLIKIRFTHDKSENLIIEYLDDGKGLIEQEILDVAIKKGLILKDKTTLWDKNKIIPLIFKPGFSTKEKVDTDAGRGMGMDVIADQIKILKGKIGLKSIDNKFVKFVIKLPKIDTDDVKMLQEYK